MKRIKNKKKTKKNKQKIDNSAEKLKENEFLDDYSNKNLSYIDYVEKENNPDGNCFFRTISYYFREYEEYYLDF